ncbi:MAG: AarF/ABC1/UbiB kinase family protein [Chloroflexi bacterium]|nr:AarF/ABC1/UbiB kinase family protein [Chloroflexota bacterium]
MHSFSFCGELYGKAELQPKPTQASYNSDISVNDTLSSMTVPAATNQTIAKNGRYRRILIFFAGAIAHFIWWDLFWGRVPGVRNWVRRSRPDRFRRWARRFRSLAVDMGGVMIKLGQFLSARVDVLPPEITDELQGLQDEVPPETWLRIRAVLQAELGDSSTRFGRFNEEPLAAASLGQAHRAWLLPDEPNGELGDPVVVKVQRPFIEQIVRVDMAALQVVARWVMFYRPIGRRADVPALMQEFGATLWEELDYISEAANAERFAQMYASSEEIIVPAVYREHSTSRVIVLEDVEAIKITDMVGIEAAGIDPKQVAERLLETYFLQIFKEGFFHADPHPGNLFVRPYPESIWDPAEPRQFWLTFVDFGMVGRVPDLMGDNLRKVMISVTQRDAQQLTEAYNDMGFFLPGANLDRIAEAQATVLDRIWGRNLLDLARPDPKEMQELGFEFRDLLFEFPFQVPQDFVYLGRCLGMVSGLVSLLDPEINPWHQIEKFGEELIKSQDMREFSVETAWQLVRPYLSTPIRVQKLLDTVEKGRLRVQPVPNRETLRRLDRIEKRLSQLVWSIFGAAGMIAGTLIYLFKRREEE